jgi:hypothetical protein
MTRYAIPINSSYGPQEIRLRDILSQGIETSEVYRRPKTGSESGGKSASPEGEDRVLGLGDLANGLEERGGV